LANGVGTPTIFSQAELVMAGGGFDYELIKILERKYIESGVHIEASFLCHHFLRAGDK
jgi:hypothetical protein